MKQLALLIGNNSYPEAQLRNACNDATKLAEKLETLGYTCTVILDSTAAQMDKELARFGTQLKEFDVGLFFFAGHGMQIEGENFLIAINTNLESEHDAKYSALPLKKVIETMEDAGNRTNILILDACRNNPFERRWRSIATRGLAPVFAPKGMIVAYATSPGQTAADGVADHGAYTEALLAHIERQNITIESCFKRVRNTLSSSTNGKQISWEHTSLMGEYYFNHSQLSDAPVTGYSESALADANFRAPGALGTVITNLKSYTWDVQNAAMGKVFILDSTKFKKDECFVLGRNIYQSAVGSARSALSFIEELDSRLKHFPENVVFHILNGILFEIYFDAHGKKRAAAKARYFEEVSILEDTESYEKSFQFIQQRLSPYASELFYIPGSKLELSVDIVLRRRSDEHYAVSKVNVDGQNVLYDEVGSGYFELKDDSDLYITTQESFSEQLATALVVPSFRLKVTYSGTQKADDFLAPSLNLQRIAPY